MLMGHTENLKLGISLYTFNLTQFPFNFAE